MNNPTIKQLEELTEPYSEYRFECDGVTNTLHFFLNEAKIAHQTYSGALIDVETGGDTLHFWIEVEAEEGRVTVDYRARMWLGNREEVPHGVFFADRYPGVCYEGEPVEMPALSRDAVFTLMYQRRPVSVIRDSQFELWAGLVVGELINSQLEEPEEAEMILMRRAYDLVEHLLKNAPEMTLRRSIEREVTAELISLMPDMEEWHEESLVNE